MKLSKRIDFLAAILLFVVIMIFLFYQAYTRYDKFKQASAFTVGETTGLRYGGQTGRYIQYHYCIEGKRYEDEQHYRKWGDINREGGKYLVIYSEENPNLNMIFFDVENANELCNEITNVNLDDINFNYWRIFWHKG